MASSFPLKKNTATKIVLPILDADGDPVSAATGLDSEYSLNGGAFEDCASESTEIGTSGIYYLNLTAGETNSDVVCIRVKTTSAGAKTSVLVFYTAAQTLDETDVAVDAGVADIAAVHVHAAGAETQATAAVADIEAVHTHINDIHDTDLPAVKTDTAAILVDTAVIGALGAGLTAITDKTNLIPADPATETNVNANEAKIDTLTTNLADLHTNLGTHETAQATSRGVVTDIHTDVGTAITAIGAVDDYVDTEVGAIKTKTDNLPSGIPKNVAFSNFEFLMVLSSDHITAATGKTVTSTISKDGGAFAATTNSVVEISGGVYKINLTQTEMNATVITLLFTETDCDQRTVTMVTSA